MFGIKKIGNANSVALNAQQIGQMSDGDLYTYFVQEKWVTLTKNSRLLLLQEVENRRAKIDGRPPIPVLEGKGEIYASPSVMGGYINQNKTIELNYRFLSGNSMDHTGFAALETILHEGRHAFQSFVIEQRPDKVAKQVLHEWIASEARYFNSRQREPFDSREKMWTLYSLQPIESDARRFARRQLIEIHNQLQARGEDTRKILREINRNKLTEYEMILRVHNMFTLDDIRIAERLVIDAMKRCCPQIDTTNFRLFDSARLILSLPKPKNVFELDDVIDKLDKFADAKMDRISDEQLSKILEEPERIQEKRRKLDAI